MNKKQLIVAWVLWVMAGLVFLSCIVNNKIAYAEEPYYSSGEINSFLYAVFYNDKDKLIRWNSDIIGVRIYGATEDEERMMNEICKLLSTLTGKQFERYYSEDIIVEFDNYFNKQM